MYEIIRSINHKGHVIQERQINSAGGCVAPAPGGGRQIIPPVVVAYYQWVIVKLLPNGQEIEVAVASSEEDAMCKIDERVG